MEFKKYKHIESGEIVEAMLMIGFPNSLGWATYIYAIQKDDPTYLYAYAMEEKDFLKQYQLIE